MRIRTRFTLWYGAILCFCLLLVAALSYIEFHRSSAESEDSDEDSETVFATVLWGCLPAAILGLAGGWILMHKTLAPLQTLTQALQRIDEDNLHEQLPRSKNGDELDRLSEVFNKMTLRLEQSFQRIRDFTLDASHELKTPLTILHGQLETALSGCGYKPEQREFLASQLDEVQRLARIVDGLALLTKADAGQVILARVPVRLDELVREALADAAMLAQSMQVSVSVERLEELTVLGDRDRLRQLLLNLSDNAVKYNVLKGTIVFDLSKRGHQAELLITNTGPGIAPENLRCVFNRFFRGDAAHNRSIDGCGLGLSIAQWIVQAHGGSIFIESDPDQVTKVIVRLPL